MDRSRILIRLDNCPEDIPQVQEWLRVGREDRLRLRGDRCSPPPEPPPLEGLPPGATLPAPPLPEVPQPLSLISEEFTTTCADPLWQQDTDVVLGPVGPPVTIPEGRVLAFFDWREVPDITSDRLRYIASLSYADAQEAWDWADTLSFEDAAPLLKDRFKIKHTQAGFVWARLRQAIEDLVSTVETIALGLLDCYWENQEQTAACPADSFTPPVVVTAGEVGSYESQAAADEEALSRAESQLFCQYGNDEITLTCAQLPPPEIGLPAYDAGDPFSVTIPENTRTSPDSKAAANALATLDAEAALDCFYCSEAQTITCADVMQPRIQVTAAEQEPVNGWYVKDFDIEIYRKGPLFFRFNDTAEVWELLRSLTSQAEELLFQSAGTDLIGSGIWVPADTDFSGTFDTTLGVIDINTLSPTVQLYADIENRVPGRRVELPACFASSPLSPAAAQEIAEAEAFALLACFWINDPITLNCAGGSIGEPVAIPEGRYSSTIAKDDAQAQALAEAEGRLLCYWLNQEVTRTCADILPTGIVNPTVGYNICVKVPPQSAHPSGGSDVSPLLGQYFDMSSITGALRIGWDEQAATDVLGDPTTYTAAIPDAPGGTGTTLKLTLPLVPTIANVRSAVRAAIDGVPGLVAVDEGAECITVTVVDSVPALSFFNLYIASPGRTSFRVRSDGPYTPPDHPQQVGSVTIFAGLYTSFESQQDANDIAAAIAEARLFCAWTNDEIPGGYLTGFQPPGADISATCETGVAFRNPGLEAGLLAGFVGKTAANKDAQLSAEARVICQRPSLSFDLPETACNHPFELRSADLDDYVNSMVTGLRVEMCRGYVVSDILGTINIVLGPTTGGAPLAEKTPFYNLQANRWRHFYVTYKVAAVQIGSAKEWRLTTEGSQPPVVHYFDSVSSDASVLTSMVSRGNDGRVWVWVGSVQTSGASVIKISQSLTGNIRVR